MGLIAGLGFVYWLILKDRVTLDSYLWVCAGAFLAGAAVVYLYLRRGGVDRFYALQA